jgi:hypothetical protein
VGLMGCGQGGGIRIATQQGKVWMGVCTCASKATTSSKGFLHLKTDIFFYCILYNILKLCIFLPCRLKINHVKEI